ncbi:IS6 family transposase [Archaeoglobus veneficus]|uniref:Transposase, IS240 n=1 Tax=Archaeoglobus veneficus (strain DSM 11195 / SNP6) TaxID=693661 RepID=F2KMI1_ARCVS|nr:IS6 family transposase [Archaeoglobus veneficus]AEA46217.1 transposase, IS240 [Archaeoglobus veneficus SNP6]AEA46348.1 transposase, IS240 [Archaeoglobus veneficus SNP6]AEA46657.1 transposase, IS240 [Archaeoglobus veneficus SNP6]AEA46665.1 transposase, IS240 [Archaeoglobus veneficus SNP6]AEA46892.1 transposase, IS240 [Archaeoglobus veneficus SNP6]
MQPALSQLVDYVKSTKVFRRNRKDVELKILAALLYFFGLSLRKTSDFLSLFEEISHESVRIYYHRLKTVLKQPEKKKRRLVAIDETKIKLEKKQIFVWAAIDVDTMECLAIWASGGRGSFEAYVFLREVLKHCENKPEIVVDRGFWYLWALKRLGLRYRHETFGRRNAVEGFFSRFKERTKRFWNRFPFRSSFVSVQSWLESFMAFYNYWRC